MAKLCVIQQTAKTKKISIFKLEKFTNIAVNLMFCLGFGSTYHSLKKCDERKYSKRWIVVALMEMTNNSNSNNSNISMSVVVSMILSFFSITNTIVSI